MYTEYENHSEDIIVLQYGGRRHYEDWVIRLPGRVFIYYHNVTPAQFFERIDFPWVEALYRGRDALSELAHLGGLADSEYNRQELLRAGFADVWVLPLIVDFTTPEAVMTPEAQDVIASFGAADTVNWLHVGRVVPNKRIEDVIRAFFVYHTRINPNSHLYVVGSDTGVEAYSLPLRQWVERLGISHAVTFTGYVTDAQLAGFYSIADVYVCMSEHEGFCIPLLEAMINHIPVIAFRSTGVRYTMGDAGVLVYDKDPRLVAHVVHLLCSDSRYRKGIIEGQLVQAEAWHPDRALQALYAWIETL
jgi:glycosyltransferase involved in cell wall biosynthesis